MTLEEVKDVLRAIAHECIDSESWEDADRYMQTIHMITQVELGLLKPGGE